MTFHRLLYEIIIFKPHFLLEYYFGMVYNHIYQYRLILYIEEVTSMLELYKKMYATLVGRVDTTVSELADIASHETCDRQRVLWAADSLRRALLETEEMYLDGTEDLTPD